VLPEEFDELSPKEELYYQKPPFSTNEVFLGSKGGVSQLVDHGPAGVRQGYAGTPEQKRKWYEKNKERILKEQKEKYHALPIEEKRKLPGYSKIGDPEELKKRSIRRRIRTLEKSPLSLDDLSRLDRFKLNIKYVKSLNDLYIEHGTRPSSEVISRELKSRLSNSDEFMDLWRKVHGNKPVQWTNMSPSGFKNSYNQTMGATKKITTDNFKVALKDLMKVEFGDNLDDFIKNDFRLNETFLAQEKNTKNALYQKRYRAILQKSPVGEGWSPEGKKAWFADPDSGWSNKVTKLNKQLGVVDNDALKFVRAHFFPIFQAKKLNNLKLFSDSAKTNFFERFTYKPNYINRLQGKTYDEDIGKALMEYNTHKNKVKLAEDFKIAATKANKLGLDVDELILNKGGTFDFVDKGRKIQKGGSLGTKGPLLINAMEEIAEVQKIKPGMLGEKQMASIIADYGSERGNQIINKIKLGETSFYPKIPESAQRKKFVGRPSKYIEPVTVTKMMKAAGYNIDKCLSSGGRVGYQNAGPVGGTNICIRNVINKEMELAKSGRKGAKEAAEKFTKFGKSARGAGWLFGWADIPIELGFALPYLLTGDIQGAKRATTAGWFGYGGKKIDEIDREKNPEAYKYFKHKQDLDAWMDAFHQEQIASSKLEELPEGYVEIYKKHGDKSGYVDFQIDQLDKASAKQVDIAKNYKGYLTEEGEQDFKAEDVGRQEAKNYVRQEVKKGWKEGMSLDYLLPHVNLPSKMMGIPSKRFAPFKPDEITNLKDLIEQKGEPYAGRWYKPGVISAGGELGDEELFGDWAKRQFGKDDPRDIYSELPLDYASQLATLEKEEWAKDPRTVQPSAIEQWIWDKKHGFAGGGLANLTRTVAPDSGPMSRGLSYLYNRVKKQ
jgi:hypothetical protein